MLSVVTLPVSVSVTYTVHLLVNSLGSMYYDSSLLSLLASYVALALWSKDNNNDHRHGVSNNTASISLVVSVVLVVVSEVALFVSVL